MKEPISARVCKTLNTPNPAATSTHHAQLQRSPYQPGDVRAVVVEAPRVVADQVDHLPRADLQDVGWVAGVGRGCRREGEGQERVGVFEGQGQREKAGTAQMLLEHDQNDPD